MGQYARGDLGGIASTAMGLFKKATSGDDTYQRNMRTKTSPADVIMWSGSKDDQTSYVNLSFPDEPPCLSTRHDSCVLATPELVQTTPGGQIHKLEGCDVAAGWAYAPFRDMHGNILV